MGGGSPIKSAFCVLHFEPGPVCFLDGLENRFELTVLFVGSQLLAFSLADVDGNFCYHGNSLPHPPPIKYYHHSKLANTMKHIHLPSHNPHHPPPPPTPPPPPPPPPPHTHTHLPFPLTYTQMNVGGASDRPVPRDIWTIVQAKLADPENADKIEYNRVRRRGVFSACTLL